MSTPFFVWEMILDVFYPPTCLGCEEDGAWVCRFCLERVPIYHADEGGDLVVLGYYAHPLLRKLLTRTKYQAATCLLGAITDLTRRFRRERREPWPWAGEECLKMCVVPSDEERVRKRGVDHTERLAAIVHRELVPWANNENILRRKRRVISNAGLPHDATRSANVHGVFEVVDPIEGAFLLIDDVYTTGATWNEAARVLKEAGASRVYGFVFAKG